MTAILLLTIEWLLIWVEAVGQTAVPASSCLIFGSSPRMIDMEDALSYLHAKFAAQSANLLLSFSP